MKYGEIKITDSNVYIATVDGNVWMTAHQIADLYGVYINAVISNIKSIAKKGIVDYDIVHRMESTPKSIIKLYNLEMIIALSYCLSSTKASIMRKWIVQQLTIKYRVPGFTDYPLCIN